ncbi:MAG: hypothetical protein IKE75_03080 [Bacilli bacterium]|nr:hypothetical protein [Bacilli bacterium]
MRGRIIIYFIVAVLSFSSLLINVQATQDNGSSSGSGYGGGGGCEQQSNQYTVCGNSMQRIAVRLTLQYYDKEKNERKIIGKPLYVAREKAACPNRNFGEANGNCIVSNDYIKWFTKNGNNGYNSEAIFTSLIGGRGVLSNEAGKKKLEPWLSKMGVKIYDLNDNFSCSVDGNDGRCAGESGYRIIIEPYVSYHPPLSNGRRQTGDSEFMHLTIKELAREAAAKGKSIVSTDAFNTIKMAMWTNYDDIDIKYNGTPSKPSPSTFNACLKNSKCGFGYNIIDIGQYISQYRCVFEQEKDSCAIYKRSDDGKYKREQDVDCDKTTATIKGKSVTFKCPNINYDCDENTSTYGRCYIKRTVIGEKLDGSSYNRTPQMVDEVDCNSDGSARTSYQGKTLVKACPYKPKYNYDIDVVCENCDDNNTNGSYQIQDTSDWEAILHSIKRTDKASIQNRFQSYGAGTLCRDEFKIVFPNANTVRNKIYVSKGLYITVNNPGGKIIDGFFNFEPIRVTRTRQCISNEEKFATGDLKLGKINLKYDDKKYGKSLNGKELTFTLESDSNRTDELKSEISSITITPRYPNLVVGGEYKIKTDTKTGYFKLPSDVYRWVAEGKVTIDNITYENGTSALKKPTGDYINSFRDVGTANLPISFTNDSDVKIKLNYELPSDTVLKEAVKGGKINYLGDGSTEKDVYNNGSGPDNPFAFVNTACAKMYGYGTTKYTDCLNNRTEKANACLKGIADSSNNDKYKYVCTLTNCSTEATAKKLGVPWNAKGGYCCPAGTVYNNQTGSCDSKVDKCRIENNICYNDANMVVDCNGREWKENCTCQVLEGGYLDSSGKFVTDQNEYLKSCPENCTPEVNKTIVSKLKIAYCSDEFDKDDSCWHYRCPYTGLCPMPGGICPGPGGENIIYRPIDLANPFPGQSGQGRDTGSNWCTLDLNRVLKCSGKRINTSNQSNNQIVYNEIINNRKVSGYDVYSEKPLYEVELDSEAIKAIRSSNKKQDYDDWTGITYSEKTGAISSFLQKIWGSSRVTGVCMDGNSDKKRCAEVSLKDE